MHNDIEALLAAPTRSIAELVEQRKRPRLGVLVPDGSRRLVLAFTDTEPGTDEFFRLCATLPARYLRRSLETIFAHGIRILLVPLLSRSVIDRGSDYRRLTALTGLALLFASSAWQDFYAEYGICVRVYGDPDRLIGTECEPALDWIQDTCKQTQSNQTHVLYFAIGESPTLGQDIAARGIEFYRMHGRPPTQQEQVVAYYGDELPPADFFIMTSKVSGLGALPRLLVNGDTEAYFLPAPGPMGLDDRTFRLILHDLLFERASLRRDYAANPLAPEDKLALRDYYQEIRHDVIGLGRRIGGIWVAG